jgi:hypothetical protein
MILSVLDSTIFLSDTGKRRKKTALSRIGEGMGDEILAFSL